MTDFVERATLVLDDQSVPAIRKINSELVKLAATAKRVSAAFASIRMDSAGMARVAAEARKLDKALDGVGRSAKAIKPTIDTSGINKAARAVQHLRDEVAKPVRARPAAPAATAGAFLDPGRIASLQARVASMKRRTVEAEAQAVAKADQAHLRRIGAQWREIRREQAARAAAEASAAKVQTEVAKAQGNADKARLRTLGDQWRQVQREQARSAKAEADAVRASELADRAAARRTAEQLRQDQRERAQVARVDAAAARAAEAADKAKIRRIGEQWKTVQREQARAARASANEQRQKGVQTRRDAVAAANAVQAAARAQRNADRDSQARLKSYLAGARNNPVLVQMREEQRAMERQARFAARRAAEGAYPVPDRRGLGADGETIGQRIGHAFANVAKQAAYNIGWAIGHGYLAATKTGYTDTDTASANLRLQGLNDEQRKSITQEAEKLAPGSPFSVGQIMGQIAENLNTANGDLKGALALTVGNLNLGALQIARGVDRRKALENAYLFQKAGEQTGRLTGADGKIDPERVKQWNDFLVRASAAIGKEVTPEFVNKAVKYARQSKYTLGERGFFTNFMLNEEMGSTAAVGLNQAIKQLSGLGVKKETLAELARLGLVTTKEVQSGSVGKAKKTTRVLDKPVDEELLRTDPLAFVEKHLFPRMKALGLDTNKPVDVAKFATRVTSDRTAQDILSGLLNRAAELQLTIDRAYQPGFGPDAAKATIENSGLVAFGNTLNKIDGLAGTAAKSLDAVSIPLANFASKQIQSITDYINAGNAEKPDPRRAAEVLALGAGATGAGLYGALAIGNYLFNPLNASATALTGSATALTAAAAALRGAALLPGGKGGVPVVAPGGVPVAGKAAKMLGGAGIGLAVGAIELAFADDKLVAAGRLVGAAAGGALGSLAGPVGAAIGVAAGDAAGGIIMSMVRDSGIAQPLIDKVTGEADKIGGQGRDPELDRLIEYEKRAFADLVKATDQRANALTEEAQRSADGALAAAEGRLAGITQALADRREALARDAAEAGRAKGAEGFNPREEKADRISRRRVAAALAFDEQDGADRAALRAARAGTLAAEKKIAESKARAADAVAKFMDEYEERRKAAAREKVDDAVRAAKANASRVNAERADRIADVPDRRAGDDYLSTGGGFGGELDRFSATFGEGISRLGPAGSDFGSQASSGILGTASSWGSAAGQAFLNTASNFVANINVNGQPGPAAPKAPNTGTLAPQ